MVEICAKAAIGDPETLGDCPFCQRVVITLEEKGVEYQLNLMDLDDKPQWFIDEVPNEELPAMKDDDGNWIVQSEEICRILEQQYPEPCLDFHPHLAGVGCNIFGNFEAFLQSNDPDDGTEQALLDELEALNDHLRDNGPYIAGDEVSALDISLAPGLLHLPVALSHFKEWDGIPEQFDHVREYLDLMTSRESFEKTTPEDQYIIAGWEQKLN